MNRQIQVVDPEELYNVLSGAASQDPTLVKSSADRLKQMLEMFGTCDGLSHFAALRTIPLSIRQQSIIQLKNEGLSRWRSKRVLPDEHKVNIKARCLSLLDEEDDVVASMNKHIIAKIARMDYLKLWDNLIPELMSAVNTNIDLFISGHGDTRSNTTLRRSLEVLGGIVKEFSSVKLPAGAIVLTQILENIHLNFEQHYTTISSNLVSLINPTSIQSRQVSDAIYYAHLLYKTLARLAAFCWQKMSIKKLFQYSEWTETFFVYSTSQVTTLIDLRINLVMALGNLEQATDVNVSRSVAYLTRHIRQFGNLFQRMQKLNLVEFVKIRTANYVVLFYWKKVVQAANSPESYIADSLWAVFPVRFLVQAMSIFKDSLSQWSPKKLVPNSETLDKGFVEEAARHLISKFIRLNPKDLGAWLADPEEWMNIEEKDNEQWEYEIRACSERVLMTLANQYEEYITPFLQTTFNEIRCLAARPTTDLDGILRKEAVYCAIGRCASHLKDVILFEQWLEKQLVVEAQDVDPSSPIIKRRIAWVIGKWISGGFASPNNDLVWRVLLHLLSSTGPGTDSVVRFTAAKTLKDCVDTLAFNPVVFLPHLPSALSQLVALVSEADVVETKKRILTSLNVVVERMGKNVTPYMDTIANSIPALWTSAAESDTIGDTYMIKGSLLETVTKLIEATKDSSQSLNPIVVPLLQESFSDEARTHLDSDGLILWRAALVNTVSLVSNNGTPSLYDVFPVLVTLLAVNLDLLGSIINIVQSYVLLDVSTILQNHASQLFSALMSANETSKSIAVKDILGLLRLIIQISPPQLWAESLQTSGLFPAFMKTLIDDKASAQVLTEHIFLLARIALADPSVIPHLIAASAVVMRKTEGELWQNILDQWFRLFDNISEPRFRKLSAMGIANLVSSGRPEVLGRLNDDIFNLWLDVFGEMKEALASSGDEAQNSTLSPLVTFWRDDGSTNLPDSLRQVQDTPEYERWKAVYAHDPVEREKLTIFVGQRLQRAQEICGGPQQFEHLYLKNTNPGVLKQLKDELS